MHAHVCNQIRIFSVLSAACHGLQMERPADLELPEVVRSPFSFGGVVYRAMTCAWNAGVTPGTVVRTFGPFSRRFTQGYADRRMHNSLGLPREDCEAFEPYMFEVLGGKGSGEVRDLLHLLFIPAFSSSFDPHPLLVARQTCHAAPGSRNAAV